MKPLILAVAVAALFAANVQAQSPGDDRASVSKPATATEKAEAKQARKAEGRAVAKARKTGDSDPSSLGTAKMHSKGERKEAAARRKAAAAKLVREPRDMSQPVN
jgi:hypothetical protein